MKNLLGYISLVFFITAFGAVWKVVAKYQWFLTDKEKKETGVTSMLSLVFSCIILFRLLFLNWYWSVLIVFLSIPISKIGINIYILFIGLLSYKEKIRIQIDERTLITDSTILFYIGTFIFIAFICI